MRESRLASGIHVLTEKIPGVRSASVGVWVRQGSAHEPPELAGGSHLLEHMVFKGTERRSAHDIALSLESLGGSLDAYTSREHTSYQARVLDQHLPEAMDVLSDLVQNPVLRDRDLDLERQVVLEEISMVDDTPDDLVFELHGEEMWRGHPYGRSILGPREGIESFTGTALRDLHAAAYRGPNIVVAAAGNVDHESVLTQVESLFESIPAQGSRERVGDPLPFRPGRRVVDRALSQTHIIIGCPGPPHSDPRRYAMVLVSAAFGGGMSSTLFQKIREELGLVYSVFSFQSFYSRAGISGVYLGTRPGWVGKAEAAVREELSKLAEHGLSEEVLEQTKAQVKGQIMLSLESTGSRLYRLAQFALYEEPFRTLDELLERIDAVTLEDVRAVSAEFWDPEEQFTLLLGPDEGD